MRMPVKVELLEEGPFVSMTSWGVLSRQETGWAHETVRERVEHARATGVLVDARDTEVTSTPSYSAEIVENFVFALERKLPIAFLPPKAWTAAHYETVWELIPDLNVEVAVFGEAEAGLEWLGVIAPSANDREAEARKTAAL